MDRIETISFEINWPALHAAMTALDKARHGLDFVAGKSVTDALGGTYWADGYEGVSGVFRLREALNTITEDAWHAVHKASDFQRKIKNQNATKGWVVLYKHGSSLLPLSGSEFDLVRVFATRRGAAVVAGNMSGRVIPGAEWEHLELARLYSRVRTAVCTLLAARAVYDLLSVTNSPYETDARISAGYADGKLHATGLRWLVGQCETEPVTVEQAQRFVDGASLEEVFGV